MKKFGFCRVLSTKKVKTFVQITLHNYLVGAKSFKFFREEKSQFYSKDISGKKLKITSILQLTCVYQNKFDWSKL